MGIVLADIDIKGAQETAEISQKFATNPKYRTVVVAVNVTDLSSVQAMVEKAVEKFGRIDYSVHSAGVNTQNSDELELGTLTDRHCALDRCRCIHIDH